MRTGSERARERAIERSSERASDRASERASDRASERAIISKMYTFINMVMTRVKNRSPDMILTAFEGKFDEKKDEIPPGICRPHMLHFFQYWEFEG